MKAKGWGVCVCVCGTTCYQVRWTTTLMADRPYSPAHPLLPSLRHTLPAPMSVSPRLAEHLQRLCEGGAGGVGGGWVGVQAKRQVTTQ